MRTTTERTPRRSRLRAGAIVAFATGVLALLVGPLATTSPAAAATPVVELSSDGTNFSSVYSGTLFPSTALMVPQSATSATFWVRNTSVEPAFLRVSIANVVNGGNAFSAALSIGATTSASPGPRVGVDAAQPCYVLTEGRIVPAGGIVWVTTSLSLADLGGRSGQNADVRFDIQVGLSSTATGSMPTTTCLSNSGTVPATGGHAPTGGTGSGSGTSHGAGAATGSSAVASGDAARALDPPDTPDGSAFAGEAVSLGILSANTDRFFQEWFVLLWVIGAATGGGIQVLVARRRSYNDVDEEVAEWLVDGQRSGRRAWSTTSVSV